MEVTNKGWINFNEQYNKKTNKFMSASMSFSNGKDEQGNWVNGFINVVAFGDNIAKLEASIGNLVEVKGLYSHKKADGKGVYPQIVITDFLTDAETNSFGNQSVEIAETNSFGNQSVEIAETNSFGNQSVEISDLDMPF